MVALLRHRIGWRLASAVAVFGVLVGFLLMGQSGLTTEPVANGAEPQNPFGRRIPLPPNLFDGGVEWINTANPLSLGKLRGKVVIVDFWTYCCINCIHVLPDLARLEKEFANELVVIGVHTAKFPGEKDSQNIREAVMRYEIEHPVVNDANMAIWNSLGVGSWPTVLVIDPENNLVRAYSGEGKYQQMRDDVRSLIKYHKAKRTLDSTPLHFQLESYSKPTTPLLYPGKVLADVEGKRLFVADSSHHRLVVADLASGTVQQVIGEGNPGLRDGAYKTARFNDPQGMAVRGDKLYVADRKNHALRLVDLADKTVTTLSGTGERGRREPTGSAKSVALASPWDVLLVDDKLYIAMAGAHQIWVLDLAKNTVRNWAGSGAEDITDGSRLEAAFAQSSGLATDGRFLYVADSETSSIRRIGLNEDDVTSLVGRGLFVFGDRDGVGNNVLLQHALGVAFHNGSLYIADTYNNKIKRLDPRTRFCQTYLGGGDPKELDEPGGLHIAGGKMYIADTNNHRLRVVELAGGGLSTLELIGLTPPSPPAKLTIPGNAKPIELPAVALKPGAPLKFTGSVTLPKNSKLDPKNPSRYQLWKIGADNRETKLADGSSPMSTDRVAIEVAAADLANAAKLVLILSYYPCEAGNDAICRLLTSAWRIPVTIDGANGKSEIALPKPASKT